MKGIGLKLFLATENPSDCSTPRPSESLCLYVPPVPATGKQVEEDAVWVITELPFPLKDVTIFSRSDSFT